VNTTTLNANAPSSLNYDYCGINELEAAGWPLRNIQTSPVFPAEGITSGEPSGLLPVQSVH